MNEQNYNAIKGTPLEELVKQAHAFDTVPASEVDDLQKRISELEEELAAAKQDVQDKEDRLAHVEPVFALAHTLYKIPNPYSQGQAVTDICAYFRKHRYQDWYEENGL